MNAHTMNRFGVIFVGTLGLFLMIALSTLVVPNIQSADVEANYKPANYKIVLDDTAHRQNASNSRTNAIE